MFKYIYKLIKKIIISTFLLYSYNVMTMRFNINIPINIFTVLFTAIFGTSGFMGIVFFYILHFR